MHRLFFGLAFLCLSVLPAVAAPEVIVTVNGVGITEAELRPEVQQIMPLSANLHGGVSREKLLKIRQQALDGLIVKELKRQDAMTRGITFSDAEYDAEVEELVKQFPSRKAFDKEVEKSGFTKETFRRFLERIILATKVTTQVVDKQVNFTDEQLLAYYDKNRNMYAKPEEFRASQIFVKVDPATSPEDRKKLRERADALLKQLKAGADFADLAARESDDDFRIKGGDIGYFHMGRVMPEIEEAIKNLKVGETSDVITTLYGFHIVKLTDKRAPRQVPFDEVKEKMRTQMTERERKRIADEWLQGLRAKAVIVYPKEAAKP